MNTNRGSKNRAYAYFYATNTQRVQAFIEVTHTGASTPSPVTVTLNLDKELFILDGDRVTHRIALSKHIKQSTSRAGSNINLNFLQFVVDTKPGPNDRVFVRVVIMVIGMSEGQID